MDVHITAWYEHPYVSSIYMNHSITCPCDTVIILIFLILLRNCGTLYRPADSHGCSYRRMIWMSIWYGDLALLFELFRICGSVHAKFFNRDYTWDISLNIELAVCPLVIMTTWRSCTAWFYELLLVSTALSGVRSCFILDESRHRYQRHRVALPN